jgi:hypothetical protein
MNFLTRAFLGGVLFVLAFYPMNSLALDLDFRGHLQSTGVLRDTDGFQYGLMDNLEVVQVRNELKFDLAIKPEYPKGQPPVRWEKAFLVYRGAYDAIFDLTDRYDNVREKSPNDFELGRDDIKWENDLREAFVDFIAEGGLQSANLRLGRQIIQWGDADGFNMANVVNPNDNSVLLFFDNPEDLANPLWMARLDYSRSSVGPFNAVDLQLLAIPDIRPTQFAPLDGTYDAPYAFSFEAFRPLPVREDVPSSTIDNMEFGVRLGLNFSDWQLYGYVFDGYQDNPAIDFRTIFSGFYTFKHPRQTVYAVSFSTFLDPPINAIFRGEASLTDEQYYTDLERWGFGVDPTAKTYSGHKWYQALLGFDKDFHPKWIGTRTALSSFTQVYYWKIDDYSYDATWRPAAEDEYFRITQGFQTNYMHGSLTPFLFGMYDTDGCFMTNASLDYTPDGKWYCKLSQISFWGNPPPEASPFAGLISTSEVSLRVGYRW